MGCGGKDRRTVTEVASSAALDTGLAVYADSQLPLLRGPTPQAGRTVLVNAGRLGKTYRVRRELDQPLLSLLLRRLRQP